jgi:hypothetical protein
LGGNSYSAGRQSAPQRLASGAGKSAIIGMLIVSDGGKQIVPAHSSKSLEPFTPFPSASLSIEPSSDRPYFWRRSIRHDLTISENNETQLRIDLQRTAGNLTGGEIRLLLTAHRTRPPREDLDSDTIDVAFEL